MLESLRPALLCSEPSVRADAASFLSAWSRKVKCWGCSREQNRGIYENAVRVAETAFAFMPFLNDENQSDWSGYPIAFWQHCLPATMLAVFFLLRYSLDGPSMGPGFNTAYRWYDFWAARLLDAVKMRPELTGGAPHLFDAYGVTAGQLRYIQWQNRFRHAGDRWRSKGWPGLANVTTLPGISTCHERPQRAQDSRTAAAPPGYDVFDFGAGRGWDCLFFTKGVRCRTLAVDADARNVGWLSRVFRPLVARGLLSVLHAVIVPHAHGSPSAAVCQSTEPEWSGRRQGLAGDYCVEVVDVPAWTCLDVVSRFGLPSLYWKMDIEESELECLRSLLLAAPPVRERMPAYLSLEAPRDPASVAEAFRLLEGLGFGGFKLVSQQIFCERRSGFGIYSSGLFGEEAVDEVSGTEWRSPDEVREDVLRCYAGNETSEGAALDLGSPRYGFLGACWSGHGHFDIHAAKRGRGARPLSRRTGPRTG